MKKQDILDAVQHGKKFYANFTKRTVRIDRKVYAVKDIEDDTENLDEDGFMARLTEAYETYKHSIPSEQSDRHRKNYFKALPYEQLSDDAILYGEPRELARCKLELEFLLGVVHGKLRWHDDWGTWFWQSPKDKDFVILKAWMN